MVVNEGNARSIAFEVLERVEDGAFSDLALTGALKREVNLDDRDRRLATELIYGILRRRGSLDWVLRQFSKQAVDDLEPSVRNLLRLGLYQILFLDGIPDRAAVHQTVEMAKAVGLQRATGYINAILRSTIRERENLEWPDAGNARQYIVHHHSLPGWLSKEMIKLYGDDEAVALAASLGEAAPTTIRVNRLKISIDDYAEMLTEQDIRFDNGPYLPYSMTIKTGSDLPGRDEGLYQVQDVASMLVVELLAPEAGDRILDCCAAPGGKTTQIAELTENGANIVATDLHPRRVELIKQGAERLGCHNIEAQCFDMTAAEEPFPPESFDRVLVDAPCSGMGVVRRNPEIRWRRTPADVTELASIQRSILATAARQVKPGGVLVYSLCTFTKKETVDVVADFLASHDDFVMEDARTVFPELLHELIDETGALHTRPDKHQGIDAFYAVRFRKKS